MWGCMHILQLGQLPAYIMHKAIGKNAELVCRWQCFFEQAFLLLKEGEQLTILDNANAGAN